MCMSIIDSKEYKPSNGCKTPSDTLILVEKAENGEKHVPLSEYSKLVAFPHVTNDGESKTGKGVQSLSFPIWFTCNHNAPCFLVDHETKECPCYGTKGFFSACPSLAIYYAETEKAFIEWSEKELVDCILEQINENTTTFRFCVIGDMTPKSFRVMLEVVKARENIDFYTYTKKYHIVNNYVRLNGGCIEKAIPHNFSILFSEWEGFKLDNPYGFALSSYVPYEKRGNLVLTEKDLICPCSNPEWGGTCVECKHCAHAILGGHVYLVEHSTKRTKKDDSKKSKRQKELKEEKKALEKAVRTLKKRGGDVYQNALNALKAFKEEHIDRFLRG